MPAAPSIIIRAFCKTSARATFSKKGVDTTVNNSATIAATAKKYYIDLQ
jgi:hypothetical protein